MSINGVKSSGQVIEGTVKSWMESFEFDSPK